MKINGFRDLRVYQRAYVVSLRVHKLTLTFPQIEQYALGEQLRRSTKSIPTNIAEGYGKQSTVAEFKRFLMIALGSCEETRVHLEYCKDLEYINNEQYTELEREYTEIGKMLFKMIREWK